MKNKNIKTAVQSKRVRRMRKLVNVAKVTWSHDVLRHSFCSYALPIYGAKVTAELAGHTEQVLFAHYREIVKKEDAVKPGDPEIQRPSIEKPTYIQRIEDR